MFFGNFGVGSIQLVSLTIAIFFSSFLSTRYSPLVVCAAILSHYIYCLYYSWPSLNKLAKSQSGLLRIAVMLVLMIGSTFLGERWLILYFGIHHCMSETFILESKLKDFEGRIVKAVFGMRFLLHTALYIHLSRFAGMNLFMDEVTSLYVLTAVAVLYLLVVSLSSLPDSQKEVLFTSDGLFILAAILIHLNVFKFDFLTLDLYHSLFWMAVPTVGLYLKSGSQKSGRFLLSNLAVVVGSGCLMYFASLYMHVSSKEEFTLLSEQVLKYGGFVHVSMSFFTMKFSHSQVLQEDPEEVPNLDLGSDRRQIVS
ncbi:hypothetical protein D3C72_882260 [compost metagenome]